jgi:hypothetical protein
MRAGASDGAAKEGEITVAERKCAGAASALGGVVWCMGWLFTIGYLHLAFWKAVLALVIWPYYIGTAVGAR